MRVLLVDDSEIFGYVVSDAVHARGHQIALATTAQEALSAIDADPPDGILLDVTLGEQRGDALCVALRRRPELDRTAIILVSSLAPHEMAALATASGADDAVEKSPDIGALLTTLERAVERRRSDRSSQE